LRVGAAIESITPDKPVALAGQMHTRVSTGVESEVKAAALAMESRDGKAVQDQAIFVACGLAGVRGEIHERVQAELRTRIPDFESSKLIISATHTHTAPVMQEGIYIIPEEGVMQPAAYSTFLVGRIATAAEKAWKQRVPASVGWGMGNAVVGYNRRSVYADGTAVMYGDTSKPEFRGLEGPTDPAVESLFFWDGEGKLIATALNVVCPSQEVEGRSAINADFWHPVRESIKAKYGSDLVVIGWAGASGDLSPHIRYRKAAEDRMRELRGLERLDEIARRIVRAWEESYAAGQQERFSDVPLKHEVRDIKLPIRLVTEEEVEDAKAEIEEWSKDPKFHRRVVWHEDVLKRYAKQQAGDTTPYTMELHALRLGDVAITTNDFELFSQFGIQMKSKSKALHTFVIQLAGPGTYVPTPHAAEGGGYSAIVQSNSVGPEGGQVLVDKTVEAVNGLWAD
jgi:hypothetical protein